MPLQSQFFFYSCRVVTVKPYLLKAKLKAFCDDYTVKINIVKDYLKLTSPNTLIFDRILFSALLLN